MAIAKLTHRHIAISITHNQTTETKLHKHYKLISDQDLNGTWPIPDILYDALHRFFNIKRVISCIPINLPLPAKIYISHDPMDAAFGAIPYTKAAWLGTSLALPIYTAGKLKQALEQGIYSAHAHRHTSPSSHILLLPNWEHIPYLARNLRTSYVHKLTFILYYPTSTPTPNTRRPKLDIYLVSSERDLAILDRTHILTTLRKAITNLIGKPPPPMLLNLHKKDPPHIDSNTSYTYHT